MISSINVTSSTRQTRKQNIIRDIEIKNKLTVTRGEVGGDKGGKGEGLSGTCIKDMWTKPKGSRIKGGQWGWLGWGEWWQKWRQLYLNNSEKNIVILDLLSP